MIKFEGLDAVFDELETLDNPTNINNALKSACMIVERAAKEKAPKGNGELRRSITSKVENYEGIVFTPLEYAPYVEYGTGIFAEEQGRQDVPWVYRDEKGEFHSTCGMQPHPYMRPSLEENREEIIRIIKEGLLNG